jgi:O-antigen ligase
MIVLAFWQHGRSAWLFARVFVLVVACAIIIRTDTRGQLIALVLALCIMPVFRWPKLDVKSLVGIPVMLGILLLGIYFGASLSINSWRWQPERMLDDFSSTRIAFCRTLLLDWIRSSPWHILFGMGAGFSWQVLGSHPHVLAVQVLVELGLLGFTMFLLIIGYTIRAFLAAIKLSKHDERARAIACCLFAVFLFRFALSFKESGLEFVYTFLLVPVLLNRFNSELAREAKRATARTFATYRGAGFALGAEPAA